MVDSELIYYYIKNRKKKPYSIWDLVQITGTGRFPKGANCSLFKAIKELEDKGMISIEAIKK